MHACMHVTPVASCLLAISLLYNYRYGPLVKHWTMRYEAKHNHLKKLAQNIGNFINIAWTLANRHQYWQCYKWQEEDFLMSEEPEIGPGM